MTEIKAHEADRLIARGLPAQPVILIYGPDTGLVSERADRLVKGANLPTDDPFCFVRLDADALRGEPGRLIDEARSIGLFGGDRLVLVQSTASDKTLSDALEILLADPPIGTTVIVKAGDLKKSAPLRKLCEKSRNAIAIPCYADDTRTLNALIDEEMQAAGLRLTSEARQQLLELIGGDRLATRNEVRKLALYGRGLDTVDENDVVLMVGDAASLSIDEAVDAALAGKVGALETGLQRIAASKTSIFLLLQATLRQLQRLEIMIDAVESGKTIAAVVNNPAERIHFKRKPAVEIALRSFDRGTVIRAQDHIHRATLETRRVAGLEEQIARQAMLALAVRAARGADASPAAISRS